jgi:hypothetical protein
MKHVYKPGGDWKDSQGRDYTVKAVHNHDFYDHLDDGWSSQLEDCFSLEADFEVVTEQGSDYEAQLRLLIKSLGGKPGGRSTIKTLEAQLKKLEEAQK